MKFKIRYADQIVGFFSLAAIVGLVVLVFALGAQQNWFTKKNHYFTMFESGANLKTGMDLTYKGFSIGKIKKIQLEGNQVRADYYILEDYVDYVKKGSLVQLSVSPIGLGSSFNFMPGAGEEGLENGSEIYRLDSRQGMKILEEKRNRITPSDDRITALMDQVQFFLASITRLTGELNNAFTGRGESPLTQTVGNIEAITRNLGEMTANMKDPDGMVPRLLGKEMAASLTEVFSNLTSITNELVTISENADTIVADAVPHVDTALTQVNTLLLQVQDVLTGVKNNPLIRKGVPDRSNTTAATLQLRRTDF